MQADTRFTSIRQQSDLQSSTVGAKNIAVSPATVYRRREQCRKDALQRCDNDLKEAAVMQLCYDGKIFNQMDRCVFAGQIVNQQKQDKLIAIKTFPEETSVTSEKVFSSITELCGPLLNKTNSVMSDTTALNTGKKSGINKRLLNFFHDH